MKRTNLHRALGLALGTTLALGLTPVALGGIADSKHNLGSTATTTAVRNNKFANTDEICVFCHTPHGANTSEPAAPLWNKNMPTATFTMYGGTLTYDADDDQSGSGGTASTAGTSPGGVSLACLSCHDGTQAIDSMINAPGSGWGAGTGTNAVTQGWTPTADAGGAVTLAAGNLIAATAATNIGTGSLSNDHPITMAYAGGLKPTGTSWTTQSDYRDTFFNAASVVTGTTNYYVDTDTDSVREKTDMILFYDATVNSGQPQVECATCHDPHTEQPLFLRMTGGNTGSQVCLACHIK